MSNLSEKVILVTGASRGIGRAVVEKLAAQQVQVVALARSLTGLEALSDHISAHNHPEPILHPFNLASASAEDYDDLRRHIDKRFGKLDGLIHIASCTPSLTPIEYYEIQHWYEQLQVNLNAPFMMTRALLPQLKRPEVSAVGFTLHPQANQAGAFWGAFAASQHAIKAFSQTFSEENSSNNVRVFNIFPPPTKTKLRQKTYPGAVSDNLCEPDTVTEKYIIELNRIFSEKLVLA